MTTPIKVAMIGDTGVGKTSLALRFAKGTFTDTASETVQVDKIPCSVTVDGQTYDLEIWDTAGLEQFGGVTPTYYRKSKGSIVVYDSTNEESYEDTEQWIEEVINYSPKHVKIILVGNKSDLKEKKVVDTTNVQVMARSKGISFIETSAKGDLNVKELFETLVRDITKEPSSQTESKGISLETNKPNSQKRKRKCFQ